MSNVTVTVDAGVCRFKTVVIATVDEEMNVSYKIKSECPDIRAMAKGLDPSIPVFEVIASPFTDNVIYKSCSCLPHVSCAVPCSIIKAGEAAAELALKRNVSMSFE